MSGTELLQHSKLNCTVWWTMISSGLPNFIRIVCLIYFIISLLRRVFDNFLNFQNSIRAHVGHTAFATLLIEFYSVVDYDSKWSTKFHKDCLLELILISLLRRLLIIFSILKNSIRAHVRHRAFATLQIELYRVVDYDSKWSTKFHKDCMLDNCYYFSFKASFANVFLIFKIVVGPMSGTELLQHSN